MEVSKMTLERLNELLIAEGYVEAQVVPTAEDILNELRGGI